MKIPTDKAISKIAALGVPGLIFVVAVGATGFSGAAAITAALAALGPGGIVGGIAFLGVAGIITSVVAEKGIDYVFNSVIAELYASGETKETILAKIDKYHISKSLKLKLIDKVNSYEENKNNNNNNDTQETP